jgi:hypothetical protein
MVMALSESIDYREVQCDFPDSLRCWPTWEISKKSSTPAHQHICGAPSAAYFMDVVQQPRSFKFWPQACPLTPLEYLVTDFIMK